MLAVLGDEIWLIQAKRRKNVYEPEGLDTVRQLKGVFLEREQRGEFLHTRGMLITTAKRFTKGALASAHLPDVRRDREQNEIVLKSFDDVRVMLALPASDSYAPWLEVLKQEYPDDFHLFANPTRETLRRVFAREATPSIINRLRLGLNYWPSYVNPEEWEVEVQLDSTAARSDVG